MEDHLELRRIDPTYHIHFQNGSELALTSDLNAIHKQLEGILFLALYRALRRTSLAPALFGSLLGILSLVAMVVSTGPGLCLWVRRI